MHNVQSLLLRVLYKFAFVKMKLKQYLQVMISKNVHNQLLHCSRVSRVNIQTSWMTRVLKTFELV